MDTTDLLTDAFGRVRDAGHDVLDGLTIDQLHVRPNGSGNSIGWLMWHLVRVQDDHVSDVAGVEQAWTADGWMGRFDLPFAAGATGYGNTGDEVAQTVIRDIALLGGYLDAVHERTTSYVSGLKPADLDRVVDRRWNPPVTLGVRLVSVIADDLQHVGQAAYVKGLLQAG